MNKSIIVEIPASEAANLESAIDELLIAMRRLDEEHEKRWETIDRLKAETRVMLEQIEADLNVEKTL